MSEEVVFVEGMRAFKPHEKAPDFVKANVVITMRELIDWAKSHHTDGEVRITIKESKGGNYYAALDTFKPKPQEGKQDDFDDDIPF